jgi:Rrf2 family protein
MKLITRDTDYAVRALCYITRHKRRVISVTELSQSLGVPKPFLRKLLQRLSRRGIVSSYKGRQGGFALAAQAGNIRLTDLIEIFQGNIRLNVCLLKKKPCPGVRQRCPLHKELDSIERHVVGKLRRLTIASLAGSFAAAGLLGGKQ